MMVIKKFLVTAVAAFLILTAALILTSLYFDMLMMQNSPEQAMSDCIHNYQPIAPSPPPPPPGQRDMNTFWGILEVSPYPESWGFNGDLCEPRPPKTIGRLMFREYAGKAGIRYGAGGSTPDLFLRCLRPISPGAHIAQPVDPFLKGRASSVNVRGLGGAMITARADPYDGRFCGERKYYYQLIVKEGNQLLLLTTTESKSESQAKAYLVSAASTLLASADSTKISELSASPDGPSGRR